MPLGQWKANDLGTLKDCVGGLAQLFTNRVILQNSLYFVKPQFTDL